MQTETRKLKDLLSIGPAMLEDLEFLGIHSDPDSSGLRSANGSPRSGRRQKVSHPSRDARPGTPPWGGAEWNPRNPPSEISEARVAADSVKPGVERSGTPGTRR